jgi:DNA-binding SARP family transcriptional activator/class 3 adenylate cyclase
VLEIRLLGPLEVRDDDAVIEIRRRKQRALLAALALRAGDLATADRLVDDLWGERAPRTAKHALENYVSELRKTLGKDVIATRVNGYVLEIDPGQVDVVQFQRLASEARHEAPAERAEKLRAALALVRAEPLVDLEFEPFALAAAPRIRELELGAREELVDAELELGRHADVVRVLEQLVAGHPYRERLRAQLMLALYRSGRQAEALTAYRDARSILVEQLGIDPGEDLQELERAILRQDPSLRAPRPEPPPTGAPSEPTPAGRPSRKTVTIVVAEVSNVTALADALDPEPLRAVLDRYHGAARTAVESFGGICGRLGGEAVQGVFGVPRTHEDDPLRSVRAAYELRELVGVLNDGLLSEHGVFLEVRTGVATGEVLVTPDANELATGQAVARAETLERGAKPGQILLDESTHAIVRDVVGAEPLSPDHAEGASGAYRLVELRPDVFGRALRLDSPLVGRRRQLSSLAVAFESAVADRALHLFTMLGAAGVGKSRLVRHFIESVESVATVFEGRCLPYGEAITYRPLVEALRDSGLGDLELGVDIVGDVRTALERIADERPLVVVLDDLQWADARLLDVVESVAASSRGASILLVCLARPDLLDDRPGWGGGIANASSLVLEPLSAAESERLMDNLLGESDLPDSVRDYVVDTGQGNPLFVEELLAMLVDRDILQRDSGRWTTTQVPAIPLPPTIQALISSRIDRLPDDERVALELASVGATTAFQRSVVAELVPDELRPDVDALIAELVRKELIRPEPAQEHGFTFRHQLIRDAAYASMPMQLRAELHERLARFFARTPHGADDDELVAYHRDHAERYWSGLGRFEESPTSS